MRPTRHLSDAAVSPQTTAFPPGLRPGYEVDGLQSSRDNTMNRAPYTKVTWPFFGFAQNADGDKELPANSPCRPQKVLLTPEEQREMSLPELGCVCAALGPSPTRFPSSSGICQQITPARSEAGAQVNTAACSLDKMPLNPPSRKCSSRC